MYLAQVQNLAQVGYDPLDPHAHVVNNSNAAMLKHSIASVGQNNLPIIVVALKANISISNNTNNNIFL